MKRYKVKKAIIPILIISLILGELGFIQESSFNAKSSKIKTPTIYKAYSSHSIDPDTSYTITGNDIVTIGWKKVKGCTGYQVYRSLGGKSYKRRITTKKLSYTDKTLIRCYDGKASYKVRAYKTYKVKRYYNSKKHKWVSKKPKKKYWKGRRVKYIRRYKYSKFTSPRTFTITNRQRKYEELIGNDEEQKEPTEITLSKPTNITMVVSTSRSITFKWDAVPNAENYKIYMRDSAKATSGGGLSGTTSDTIYTLDKNLAGFSLDESETYYVSIKAVKGSIESEMSDIKGYKTIFGGKWFPENKNVKLPYGDAEIYLGQEWTKELKLALSVNASPTYEFERGNLYFEFENQKIGHLEKSYVFDAGDYDNYLVVNVCENQIIGWYTNAKVQAVVNGDAIKRGQNKTFNEQYDLVRYTNIVKPLLVPFNKEDYEDNGVVISGACNYRDINDRPTHSYPKDGKTYYECPTLNRWHEKQIGLHLINAYRTLSNRHGHKLNPLKYNKYLDGTEPDGSYILYTGDIEYTLPERKSDGTYTAIYHAENQAFGAQGFVDTLTATKPVNTTISMHNMDMRSEAPCGGLNKDIDISCREQGSSTWSGILDLCGVLKSQNTSLKYNGYLYGNAASGGVGESALVPYLVSSGHLTWYTADNNKIDYIGIGLKDGYNQVFGSSK